jgi:NAD(P)-dependent dehydrogenase (short-subunit alcohol dehydrogenase family)
VIGEDANVTVRELFDLTGKTAIVTGGGSGIGRQMAEALAELGANLVLCARKVERCEQAASELSQLGVKAIGMACDVRDPEQVQAVVDRTISEFGAIDVLLNNAGATWGAPAEEMPREGWEKVLDVNLNGTFFFSQAAGRHMIERGEGGAIVNTASVAGIRAGMGDLGTAGYHTSKAGVIMLTRALAGEWAKHGIRVNAIAPGWFPSDMSKWVLENRGEQMLAGIPLGRFGGPHDLKGAIAYLSTPASGYVTGQTIAVDGGLTV